MDQGIQSNDQGLKSNKLITSLRNILDNFFNSWFKIRTHYVYQFESLTFYIQLKYTPEQEYQPLSLYEIIVMKNLARQCQGNN